MKNTVTDLEISAYQMSDEELGNILDAIFFTKTEGIDLKNLSNKMRTEIAEFSKTIPLTKSAIDALVGLGMCDREYLEEENRRLYAECGWEKYL